MNYPDRYPTWITEQAPGYKRPRASTTLALFAIITVTLLALMGGYPTVAEQANRGKPATLCQEHAGRPGWDAVCPKPEPVSAKR
jgi:hypothetical protein